MGTMTNIGPTVFIFWGIKKFLHFIHTSFGGKDKFNGQALWHILENVAPFNDKKPRLVTELLFT